jgi:hypothetical protein
LRNYLFAENVFWRVQIFWENAWAIIGS